MKREEERGRPRERPSDRLKKSKNGGEEGKSEMIKKRGMVSSSDESAEDRRESSDGGQSKSKEARRITFTDVPTKESKPGKNADAKNRGAKEAVGDDEEEEDETPKKNKKGRIAAEITPRKQEGA